VSGGMVVNKVTTDSDQRNQSSFDLHLSPSSMAKRSLPAGDADSPDAKRARTLDNVDGAMPVVVYAPIWPFPLLPEIWHDVIYQFIVDPIDGIMLSRTCTGLHMLWRPSANADIRHSDLLRLVTQYYGRLVRELGQGTHMTTLPIWKIIRLLMLNGRRLSDSFPSTILRRICPTVRAIYLSSDALVYEDGSGACHWPKPWDWDVISRILRNFVASMPQLSRVDWCISDPPIPTIDPDLVMPPVPQLPFVRRLVVDIPGTGDSPCSCPFALFPNITRLSLRNCKMIVPGRTLTPMLRQLTRLTVHLDHIATLLQTSALPALRRLKLHDLGTYDTDSIRLARPAYFIRVIGGELRVKTPLLARLTIVASWDDSDRRDIKKSLDFIETFVWADHSAHVARIYRHGKSIELQDFSGRDWNSNWG